MLTIGFVTGTEPGKWFRRYEEFAGARVTTLPADDPFPLLAREEEPADIVLMRLPDARVGDAHHVVRLYEEARGVAVPKDSVYAEVGEKVDPADLAGEHMNFHYQPGAEPAGATDELRGALQVVAANVAVAMAPLPLLKALSKKQVVPLQLRGDGEATEIALVWFKERDGDDVQDFVGIVKGRSPRSSRSSKAPAQRQHPGRKQTPKPRNRKRR